MDSILNRRTFCALTGQAAAGLALSSSNALGKTRPRPSFLFCLADDWGMGHASIYGDPVVKTPAFDAVAANGALFFNTFCPAPTCTASRSSMLTGQAPHRLEDGANLYGCLPPKFKVYPDVLEAAGYKIGYSQKGWGPGDWKACGRTRNPAGPSFNGFADFFHGVGKDEPFSFWFSSTDPHRPYLKGSGRKAGLDPAKVVVPPMWPDTPEVRNDILDYYAMVERFDRDCGAMLELLRKSGRLENTIVVMTGDNGWPFPRAKANLYDGGTMQPLAVQWPAAIKPGSAFQDFVNLADFAPTFLEAAGLPVPKEMTAHSLVGLLSGREHPNRRKVAFTERERHCAVRPGVVGYPMRAIRTDEFLLIHNFHPERWPAGDPDPGYFQGPFGDVDQGGTKQAILDLKTSDPRRYNLTFGKRPEWELYDVRRDPWNLTNLAGSRAHAVRQHELTTALETWMRETADPRVAGDGPWDKLPYYGEILKR